MKRAFAGLLVFVAAVTVGVQVRRWLERGEAPDGADLPPGWWSPAVETAAETDLDDLGYLAGYEPADGGPTGVVRSRPQLLADGARLVLSAHRPGAELIDAAGRTLHEWTCALETLDPGTPAAGRDGTWWRRARVLPDGGVIAILEGRAIVRLDRHSRVVWSSLGRYHHDFDLDDEGRVWVLVRRERTRPETGELWAEDGVRVLDPAGRPVAETSIHAAVATAPWVEPEDLLSPDPLHTNALVLLGVDETLPVVFAAGRLLLSIRELDALAVLDPQEERIVWWQTGAWRRQHAPALAAGGRLTLFDNLGLTERSRVLEIGAAGGAVLRSWAGDGLATFRSRELGHVQPLPGGSVLVTESTAGRAFELSPDHDVVWEYRNPHRTGAHGELVAALATVERVAPSDLAWLEDGSG